MIFVGFNTTFTLFPTPTEFGSRKQAQHSSGTTVGIFFRSKQQYVVVRLAQRGRGWGAFFCVRNSVGEEQETRFIRVCVFWSCLAICDAGCVAEGVPVRLCVRWDGDTMCKRNYFKVCYV